MAYEVVVVGGGIGGLTAAALLAARGASVCLFEKESRAGGCAATFEKFGYEFEQGASLYASWQPGEIHERVFAELGVSAPEVRRATPAYVVRLPDGTDLPVISPDAAAFETSLRAAFPECAEAAIKFYRELAPTGAALRRVARRAYDLRTASRLRLMRAIAPELRMASRIRAAMNQTVEEHLGGTSLRFRRFIDAQLQMFALRDSRECAYLYAAVALGLPLGGMYVIRGGAQALADTLVEAIRKSGGTVRLDTTVLRLAYDVAGRVTGVDLLSGETIEATRAVVSNLTVWDTYGKLVGLNRTPPEMRRRLKELRGWGAYLLYLGMDEGAAEGLPAEHILALTDWCEGEEYDAERAQFMFSCAPGWDTRAPTGKRAVTVSTFTEPTQWFAFHRDETEHEEQDQSRLEECWERIHRSLPELGDRIEVIETATPRSFYEKTRRKLGMVGGVGQSPDVFGMNSFSHKTALENLFMVGDSAFPGQGIAAVTQSALIVADEIAPRSHSHGSA
ncbi:MAG TPA: NAD(P)/FAD-dependent oxidoreductase [Pyrinomonadaceae bacterium]|jgi:C-3',4' desaturase CrtD|nr:NAD(P)/FAD-dependent oxidoreductase [Pyrinomonadaceae bacterium]